jgi:hypothetical protein
MYEPWFPDRSTSRAVLIGASTFRSVDLPDLPAVMQNLVALEQVLTNPEHGVIGGCTLLVNDDVTDAKVGAAIAAASTEASDLLLIYYAGHGVLDDDGHLHLARPDTTMEYISWTSVSIDLLKRDLGRAKARARVLVLDCCFSGRAINAMAGPSSLVAGQLDLSGTYTLTSTSATAPSHAPPGRRYTSFTNAFLGALAQPDPLTLDQIYRRIDGELDGLGLPRPQHHATNNAATLVLARGPVIPFDKQPVRVDVQPTPRRVFNLSHSRTPTGSATLWTLGAIGALGFMLPIISWLAGSSSPVPLVAFVCSILLLSGLGIAAPADGTLKFDQYQLAIVKPLGPQTNVPWQRIYKISVFAIDQSTVGDHRCRINIELKNQGDSLPRRYFARVQHQERPTFDFGEIRVASEVLANALRQTVGSTTFVETRYGSTSHRL